jgi:uncharacterized protein YsxB (DUF464 family)
MKQEHLDQLFKELQGSFDLKEPEKGHEERFLKKLKGGNSEVTGVVDLTKKKKSWLRPLSVAASLVVLVSIGLSLFDTAPTIDEQVTEISPEVSQTQFYFASLIEEQIRELEKSSSPETQQIIDDTMVQLQRLETNYQKLEQDLVQGGNSKLILSAMVTNFQTRIDLLKDVIDQIENIKTIKKLNDANFTI